MTQTMVTTEESQTTFFRCVDYPIFSVRKCDFQSSDHRATIKHAITEHLLHHERGAAQRLFHYDDDFDKLFEEHPYKRETFYNMFRTEPDTQLISTIFAPQSPQWWGGHICYFKPGVVSYLPVQWLLDIHDKARAFHAAVKQDTSAITNKNNTDLWSVKCAQHILKCIPKAKRNRNKPSEPSGGATEYVSDTDDEPFVPTPNTDTEVPIHKRVLTIKEWNELPEHSRYGLTEGKRAGNPTVLIPVPKMCWRSMNEDVEETCKWLNEYIPNHTYVHSEFKEYMYLDEAYDSDEGSVRQTFLTRFRPGEKGIVTGTSDYPIPEMSRDDLASCSDSHDDGHGTIVIEPTDDFETIGKKMEILRWEWSKDTNKRVVRTNSLQHGTWGHSCLSKHVWQLSQRWVC